MQKKKSESSLDDPSDVKDVVQITMSSLITKNSKSEYEITKIQYWVMERTFRNYF